MCQSGPALLVHLHSKQIYGLSVGRPNWITINAVSMANNNREDAATNTLVLVSNSSIYPVQLTGLCRSYHSMAPTSSPKVITPDNFSQASSITWFGCSLCKLMVGCIDVFLALYWQHQPPVIPHAGSGENSKRAEVGMHLYLNYLSVLVCDSFS